MVDVFQNDLKRSAGLPTKDNRNYQAIGVNQLINAAKNRIQDFRMGLRVKDEQQFIQRYKWGNLPEELDTELIERILYYKGRAALFRFNDKYFFLPFALSSDGGTGIDPYGRYNNITPLVFNGSQDGDKDATPLLKGLSFEVVKNVAMDYVKSKDPNKCAVICWDYSPQGSQDIIPRYKLQDTLLNAMAEQIVLSRSAILANMPADTVLVTDPGQRDSVMAEVAATENAILAGIRLIPITLPLQTNALQKHTGGSTIVQDTWQNYASLDSLRLSQIGIIDKGPSDKKAQKLKAEQDDETSNTAYVYDNGLNCRQRFCNIVNAVFGENFIIGMSENAASKDLDKDGDVDTDVINYEGGNEENG